MAVIDYDARAAAAFAAGRHLRDDALTAWRERVAHHLRPTAATRLLDLGSGTGQWSAAFRRWYGVSVTAVEPSAAMRAVAEEPALAGDAAHIPLPDGDVDAVWLSTVVHHIPDLPAAAAEIRRVLRPGGSVLIRSVFAGRHDGVTLMRYFPEAAAALDARFPSVAAVAASFAAAGFAALALEPVPQLTAPALGAALAGLDRRGRRVSVEASPARLILTPAESRSVAAQGIVAMWP
ncbi:class I SAM-dependent methyltransferase [Dactylosporangium sp. CA-233914]|uniref:class I SAM-dependent methyltransferase n=1 Tax=Dactylosporangium sp. CA-233914 TaxID=3239934 RepID=UPI003D901B4B